MAYRTMTLRPISLAYTFGAFHLCAASVTKSGIQRHISAALRALDNTFDLLDFFAVLRNFGVQSVNLPNDFLMLRSRIAFMLFIVQLTDVQVELGNFLLPIGDCAVKLRYISKIFGLLRNILSCVCKTLPKLFKKGHLPFPPIGNWF